MVTANVLAAPGFATMRRVLITAMIGFAATPLFAQTDIQPGTGGQTVAKSYDARLLRLAEILGAVHHLREICGANEGQLWRDQMTDILKTEEPPAQLRGRMVAAFNASYRGYQRTYGTCTPSAKTAASRFFSEGMVITKGLASEIGGNVAASTKETATSKAKVTR